MAVWIYRTPFEPEPPRQLPAGQTVRQILDAIGWLAPEDSTLVLVGQVELLPTTWNRLRPKAGRRLVVIVRPRDPATLALIGAYLYTAAAAVGSAVVAAAAYVPGAAAIGTSLGSAAAAGLGATGAFGTFIVGSSIVLSAAGIVYGSQALLGSFLKPPDTGGDVGQGGSGSPTLQGVGNQVRRNEPVREVFGEIRFAPDLGALPYTTQEGDENVAHFLFLLGHGPLTAPTSEMRFGELGLLATYPRAQIAVREGRADDEPFTLYPSRVFQANLSNTFDEADASDPVAISDWVEQPVPGEDIERVALDFACPAGLHFRNPKNHIGPSQFGLQIQLRLRSSPGGWFDMLGQPGVGPLGAITAGSTSITTARGLNVLKVFGQNLKPFLFGLSCPVSIGTYNARVRRVAIEPANRRPGGADISIVLSQCQWQSIKGFRFAPPVREPRLATIEIRIPLDAQFTSFGQNFNCLVRKECRIYDPDDPGGADADGWSITPRFTRNAAACMRELLQGRGARRPVSNALLVVDDFTRFYEWCRDYDLNGLSGLTCDDVIDTRATMREHASRLAASSFGQYLRRGHRIGVIFDAPQGSTVGAVVPANSSGFRYRLTYPRKIHAVKAQFVDSSEGYNPQGFRIVYADGYSRDGTGGTQIATDIETMRFNGTTRPAQAYVLARYWLANRALRRRAIEVEQDFEHLGLNVGDVVDFAHDGALVGQRSGRVTSTSTRVYWDGFESIREPYSGADKTLSGASAVYNDPTRSEGSGSLRTTSLVATETVLAQDFGASSEKDWTDAVVEIDVRPESAAALSASDGFALRLIGPTIADWVQFEFGSGSLTAGLFETIAVTLGTTTPDDTAGTFDAAVVRGYELRTNRVSAAVGRVWRFDALRVSDPTAGVVRSIRLDGPVDLSPGASYALQYRRVDTSAQRWVSERVLLVGPDEAGLAATIRTQTVLLTEPLDEDDAPEGGEVYSFGSVAAVTARMILKAKQASTDLRATLLLVDEAPGVYTATGTLPDFEAETDLPVPITQLGPARPSIDQIVADESALLVTREGSLITRIVVIAKQGAEQGRPSAVSWQLRYRKTSSGGGPYKATAPFPATSNLLDIRDVDEGESYEVLLIASDVLGRPSEAASATILVTGKTLPPPDVEQFRIEGDEVRWELTDPPADLAGFRIKRGSSLGLYSDAVSLHGDQLVTSSPFSIAHIDPFVGRLYCVAVDRAGNESVNAAVISGAIGEVPIGNVVNEYDVAAAGFPITDAEERIVDGFERLDKKETPDGSLDLGAEHPEIASVSGNANTQVDISDTPTLEGLRALELRDTNGSGAAVTVTFAEAINRFESKLALEFYGAKAGAYTVRVQVTESGAPTFWSRFDFATTGQAQQTLELDLDASPSATGGGGPVDPENVGSLTISIVAPSPTTGDLAYLDDLRWIGGALNTVEVSGGVLVTRGYARFYTGSSGARVYTGDPTELIYGGLFGEGIYDFSASLSADDLPCDIRVERNDDIGVQHELYYRSQTNQLYSGDPSQMRYGSEDGTGLFYTPVTTYALWPGVLQDREQPTPVEFRLVLHGGKTQAEVTDLRVVFDVEDESEEIEDLVVSAAGTTRLPITKSYRDIRTVIATLQTDGNGGRFFEVVDKDAVLGPLVRVRNVSETLVQGLADVRVVGSKGA